MKSRVLAAARPANEPRIALGFSGGGDSTALLLALRAVFPEMALDALIVDHGLRAESAAEAERSAHFAEGAGAHPQILRWRAPRPGQARARQARHALLAEAARKAGASVICLAHTLDDRLETLRMRAARSGPEARMAGPRGVDFSPVWPQGEGQVITRPFLGLRRAELRAYLRARAANWIDDPSNDDVKYERVRLRAAPLGDDEARNLLRRSDAAQCERQALNADAAALIDRAAFITAWGGAQLNAAVFAAADRAAALKALETLVLAVSGAPSPPAPAALDRLLTALLDGEAGASGGAHLTASAVLGRDAGAAGRADGTLEAETVRLEPGQCCVFDGRWRIQAESALEAAAYGSRAAPPDLDVPAALRPALCAVKLAAAGSALACLGGEAVNGLQADLLCNARISARLLPPSPPTWFYGQKAAGHVRSTLAKSGRRANITRNGDVPAPLEAAYGASRGEDNY